MWKKKNIKNAVMFGLSVTALLGETMFNQDLKHEYNIPPDPPQIPRGLFEFNHTPGEVEGISGIDAGPTGMFGGSYYGSEYYGGSDKTKGTTQSAKIPERSSTSKKMNGPG